MVNKKDRNRLNRVLMKSRSYDDLYFGAQDIRSVDKRMNKRNLSAKYAESKGISQFDRLFQYLQNIVGGR